ncbi:polyadenylate-binding protein-interacting protein 1-like isoform X1 [Branchiostoma floridae]|uniref:Polyadenylate-binding protein-interacting protein 1 n=2 Tax=Branchiostoma floridae TaxID=7739 RepID=A0A9J7MEF6_BRAFL|nr:polyadenylate-binding protein-interacting protein 1-like isoform X1 [Branchiostoma floridae]
MLKLTMSDLALLYSCISNHVVCLSTPSSHASMDLVFYFFKARRRAMSSENVNASGDSPSVGRGRGRGVYKGPRGGGAVGFLDRRTNSSPSVNSPDPATRADGKTGSPEKPQLRRPFPQTIRDHSIKTEDDVDSTDSRSTDTDDTSISSDKTLASSSKLSVHAAEFVPRTVVQRRGSNSDINAIEHLKATIVQLTDNPGDFHDLLGPLSDTLNTWISDGNTVLEIVDTIYEQACEQPNFRYTGAVLCDHLSHNLTVSSETGNFRQHLLKRCHVEFEQREEAVKDRTRLHRLERYTLFMAELFLALQIHVNGKQQRMVILRKALRDLINTLLDHPSDSTLRCAAQALKLTGGAFEDYLDLKEENVEESKKEMDEIFSKLKKSAAERRSDISKNVLLLVVTVVELRAKNWNKEESAPAAEASLPSHLQTLEPVYFGKDGRPIGPTDTAFWEGAAAEDYYGDYGDYGDYYPADGEEEYYDGAYPPFELEDGTEMDEEAAMAFEDFLRDSEQI